MLGLAFAMGSPQGGAPAGGMMAQFQGLIPLVFMFAIFYFLLIRPQQKKAKEHRALLEALKKGDQVVTLEISAGVNVKINKGFIASVIKKD